MKIVLNTAKNTANPPEKAPVDNSFNNPAVVAVYKVAGGISNSILKQVRSAAKDGSTIFELTQLGDKLLAEEVAKLTKEKKEAGIAFPTCVNPNNIPAHLAPVNAADTANLTLKDGDVVNVMLGVQVDGFPAVVAETFVVGELSSSPVSGKKADLLHAAWNALEAAVRTFTTDKRNWDVTNVVDKVAKEFGTVPLESMLLHNQGKNLLYGPKEIILNPTKENKNQMDTFKFEEGEVYGLDVLVSTSAEGKVKLSEYKTSLYKLTGTTYALKLKTSHKTLGDFKRKALAHYPFNVKNLEDPRKARVGLIECVNHQVMLAYDIQAEKQGEFVGQFFTTLAVTKDGVVRITSPSFDGSLYQSDKALSEESKALVAGSVGSV